MCIEDQPIRTTIFVTFGLISFSFLLSFLLFMVFKLPQLWSRWQVYFHLKRRRKPESQLPCVYVCVALFSFTQLCPAWMQIACWMENGNVVNYVFVTSICHRNSALYKTVRVSYHRHHMSIVIIMHSLNCKIWQGEGQPSLYFIWNWTTGRCVRVRISWSIDLNTDRVLRWRLCLFSLSISRLANNWCRYIGVFFCFVR